MYPPPKPPESVVLIGRKHCLHFGHQTHLFDDFVKNGPQKGGLGHAHFNDFGVFFGSSFPKGLQGDFGCLLESSDLHKEGYSLDENIVFTFACFLLVLFDSQF